MTDLINCDPPGLKFYDGASRRWMKLVYEGHWAAGWIVFKHPDGQWVTLREATSEDLDRINAAVVKAHHEE
jgi:hypothetical protein